MHLRWTDPAVRDLTHICDYIREHSRGDTARRIALSIHQQLDVLNKFPGCGRTGRKLDTRELVFSALPYVAVYRINGGAVEILRILHGAQDWPD
jgi:toxin ParE1/3/4